MKSKLIRTSFVIAVLCFGALATNGQTAPEQDINRLKDEIQRRELIDRDQNILPADKAVNRTNLEKARASVRALLQTQIDAKRKLKFLLGPAITPEESQTIEAALLRLETDLQALDRGTALSRVVATPPVAEDLTNGLVDAAPPQSADRPSTPADQPTIVSGGEQPSDPLTSSAAPSPNPQPAPNPNALTPTAANVLPIRSCAIVQQNLASASTLEKYFCGRVAVIQRDKHRAANPIVGLDLRRDFFFFMITLLAREGRAQYVVAHEDERVDKQGGSDASSSGSTSLVTKGSVPAILGFAVDSGALLKSTNGSTITFRGNVAGLAKAAAGKGFISGYDEDSSTMRFLRRTSFSFSFDPTRGNPTGVFTGSKQQISNYSFRVDLYNKRDARDARYKKDWDDFLANQAQPLALQIQSSLLTLTDPSNNTWKDSALQDWYVLTDNGVRGADGIEQIDAALRAQLNKAPKNLSATTLAELRSFDTRFKAWLDQRELILDRIAKAPIITFEYINDRPLNAPSLSKLNFIGETGFGKRLDLTFNGAITIFNQRPAIAGINRVRDFQFAIQLDTPLAEAGLGVGKPVFSFAGRYERLKSNAHTAAGTFAPNTRGDIAIGQFKLTIPIKGSGIRIPISLSFANRTELIKEKEVRGNFGFSFDLDTLFAKFKPF